MLVALRIHVDGIVQGVGFRPFVYRLAKRHLVNGWVLNAADGVEIHAEGEQGLVDEFVMGLSEDAPAAAQVRRIDLTEVPPQGFDGFEIRFSDSSAVTETTLVSPDLATCDDCLAELFNPRNRRYRYPFINCTNCGPRFTIIESLPYDRPRTSMKGFTMCAACQHEYDHPENRRFHAQPDACFECGPHISWYEGEDITWGNTREESDAILSRAVEMLSAGKILAVKGLGGFHLVCDAANEATLAQLRRRKRREGKAFAVMVADVDAARAWAQVGAEEAAMLQSPARPIVLLRKRPDVSYPAGLADKLPELGVMLPTTPLQHLLVRDFGGMLVMTSGNLHDEPIQTDDDEARRALAGIADAFLGNDRAILSRYDDSVVRLVQVGDVVAQQVIRRARGLAPQPVAVDNPDGALLFATGPEQKNTFTLVRGGQAFVSQHIGDMENAETFDAWLEAKRTYERLFEARPASVACDLHPEYLTSKWAAGQALPVERVQHHHAHVTAVMGENGIDEAVCGIAFDGTGYGPDGAIWGGEVLLANRRTYERFANFAYVPMPGGAAAIKHPLRMAYGVLWEFDLLEHPGARDALQELGEAAAVCGQMIERGLNTPYTSSVGRLFDAASALLGICTEPTYEGEGAILLEAAMSDRGNGTQEGDPLAGTGGSMLRQSSLGENAHRAFSVVRDAERSGASPLWGELRVEPPVPASGSPASSGQPVNDGDAAAYHLSIVKNSATSASTALDTSVVLFDAAPVFEALLDDKLAGVPVPLIARRFHDAFVEGVVQSAQMVNMMYGISLVTLSGGVFMNRYLLEHAASRLAAEGFSVAINRDLPPNDASVSFGEAVVALARGTQTD